MGSQQDQVEDDNRGTHEAPANTGAEGRQVAKPVFRRVRHNRSGGPESDAERREEGQIRQKPRRSQIEDDDPPGKPGRSGNQSQDEQILDVRLTLTSQPAATYIADIDDAVRGLVGRVFELGFGAHDVLVIAVARVTIPGSEGCLKGRPGSVDRMTGFNRCGGGRVAPKNPIQFTNTMGHRLEPFQPIQENQVTVYTCGPTVYNFAHIGNFRASILGDMIRRVLEYNGYQVRHVRNITDVGHMTDEMLNTGVDRIEREARQQNMSPWDIAAYYTDAFFQDCRRLNLLTPTETPRATEYIGPMIQLIERLIEQGHAYVSDGNVYFDVASFPTYGKLSGNTVDDLIAGARVEVGEGKRSPADFALWKAAGEDKIMRWESPWGMGVPGWHIECSAMSMRLLGEHIDIHTGGQDNVFPHHEDERAQSEAAFGAPFVRYWLHNAFLQLADGGKMSKSEGNIWTISDLMERGYHPLTYRYFTYQAHYRTPLNFSWDALDAAQTALYRMWEAAAELVQSGEAEEMGKVAETYREKFNAAINRDLDMPGAIAVVHEVLGSKLPPGQKRSLLENFDTVLALDLIATGTALSETTAEQREALEERAQARANRDWAQSDSLRAHLADLGLEVRDSAAGQRWVRKDVLPRRAENAEQAAAR